MTYSYLDKLQTTLPGVQGQQILRILQRQKEKGQIRTVDELKNKLKTLTTALLEKRIQPTMKLWKAIAKDDISSEEFNDMVEHISDDLETAFSEANDLYSLLDTHGTLIKDVSLKIIECSLNKLEAQVELYEFIRRSGEGFDDAVFDTFREVAAHSVSRTDVIAGFVYLDPRTGKFIPAKKNAVVDQTGERLILNYDKVEYITLRGAIHLAGSDSARSELEATFMNSEIENLIDGQKHTYWSLPVLLSYNPEDGVSTSIAIELPVSQDVNFVEIDPASPHPMSLESITYLDGNATARNAYTTSTILDKETQRICFDRVSSSQLTLNFKQENFQEKQFEAQDFTNFQKATLDYSYLETNISLAEEDLLKAFSSSFIKDKLSLSQPEKDSYHYYEYLLALDNIRAGRIEYTDSSIYVSSKQTINMPGQLLLRTNETRPVQVVGDSAIAMTAFTYPTQTSTEDLNYYHGSIEYWATAQYLDKSGNIIATKTFPVLPWRAKRIYHEKLVFSGRVSSGLGLKDGSSLMFYTASNSSDVLVYKNGNLLTYGVNWFFVDPADASALTNETAGSGSRMKRGIRIADRSSSLDHYTASYTPTFGNSYIVPKVTDLITIIDLVGDRSARLLNEGKVILDPITYINKNIAKADIYLTIILRRNSINPFVTPMLEDFLFAAGYKDTTKFE